MSHLINKLESLRQSILTVQKEVTALGRTVTEQNYLSRPLTCAANRVDKAAKTVEFIATAKASGMDSSKLSKKD